MSHGEVHERIDRFVTSAGLAARGATVIPISGDASDRRYFRVRLNDAPSQVLAVHPGPIDFVSLPFTNVAALLQAMPVPVPRVIGHDNDLGIIALEDLGDVTLQAYLGDASADERAALLRQAVLLIHTMQHRGRALASTAYVPYTLAFDVEKLTWELRFFVTHFLDAHRRIPAGDAWRAALVEEFAAVAEELAAERRVLCHRDYHSRNLMLRDGVLHIIDFQDARMGPETYDLASLLRDSYVAVPEAEVDALLAYFLECHDAVSGATTPSDPREFRRRLDLMALQRNLKALGTFGFQATARANPAYLQYVPRTLGYVRAHLATYPRFGRLRELLAAYLPEVR